MFKTKKTKRQPIDLTLFIQKLEFDMDQKSFDTCIKHHRKLLNGGIIRESDCYNHVTTMVQYTSEGKNLPTNNFFICSSHGAKPKIKTYKVCVCQIFKLKTR